MKITEVEIAQRFITKHKNVMDCGKYDFHLTLDGFAKMFKEVENCPYTGRPISKENASFERKNPFLGYTNDNTVIVDPVANKIKGGLDWLTKDTRIIPEVRLQLLDDAKQYIIDHVIKPEAVTPAESVVGSLLAIKHAVRPSKPLKLDCVYKHGSVFQLAKDTVVVGEFMLLVDDLETTIAYGRGTRNVTVKYSKLINVETLETCPSDVDYDFADIITVVERK